MKEAKMEDFQRRPLFAFYSRFRRKCGDVVVEIGLQVNRKVQVA